MSARPTAARAAARPDAAPARPTTRVLAGQASASSLSDHWGTPRALFERLNAEHRFSVDAAASHVNHLLPTFWTVWDDGLAQSWAHERIWCNPPYSAGNLERWSRKAALSVSVDGCPLAVLLVPAYPAEGWWQRWVVGQKPEARELLGVPVPEPVSEPGRIGLRFPRHLVEVELLPGRQRFVETQGLMHGGESSARFSSALVVLRGRR